MELILYRTKIALLIFVVFVSGCATMKNRTKTLYATAGAVAVGGVTGAIMAPDNESALLHGLLWGGVAGTITGIVSLFVFDSENDLVELRGKNDKLLEEIASFNRENAPTVEAENEINFGKPLPNGLKDILKPGRWRLYKLDRWIDAGENQLLHQDKMIEIVPAKLNPNIKGG